MSNFIKIDDQIININHIIKITKETYSNNKSKTYTKIILIPNSEQDIIDTDIDFDDIWNLIVKYI